VRNISVIDFVPTSLCARYVVREYSSLLLIHITTTICTQQFCIPQLFKCFYIFGKKKILKTDKNQAAPTLE